MTFLTKIQSSLHENGRYEINKWTRDYPKYVVEYLIYNRSLKYREAVDMDITESDIKNVLDFIDKTAKKYNK